MKTNPFGDYEMEEKRNLPDEMYLKKIALTICIISVANREIEIF